MAALQEKFEKLKADPFDLRNSKPLKGRHDRRSALVATSTSADSKRNARSARAAVRTATHNFERLRSWRNVLVHGRNYDIVQRVGEFDLTRDPSPAILSDCFIPGAISGRSISYWMALELWAGRP